MKITGYPSDASNVAGSALVVFIRAASTAAALAVTCLLPNAASAQASGQPISVQNATRVFTETCLGTLPSFENLYIAAERGSLEIRRMGILPARGRVAAGRWTDVCDALNPLQGRRV